MNTIYGKDFMLYLECETLTGSVMLPICIAKSVQLGMQAELGEARGAKDSKCNRVYYKKNTYTLSLDGYITFSNDEIQQQIIEVEGKLLETDNKLVSIGGVAVQDGGSYFILENALRNWKFIKWVFESSTVPIRWRGEAAVSDISDSFQADGLAEFSSNLRVNGDIESFHTPIPTDMAKESQTNTLPTESFDYLGITPVQNGSIWNSGFTIEGNPLPGGKLSTLGVNYTVQIGDDLPSIIQGLAALINAALPSGVLSATADDNTLHVVKDNNSVTEPTYTNHTATLRSVGLKFSSSVNYDFYRIKVEQGANTWYVDVVGKTPTIILPVGTYNISVSGMGQDLQYSDYSETKTITIN